MVTPEEALEFDAWQHQKLEEPRTLIFNPFPPGTNRELATILANNATIYGPEFRQVDFRQTIRLDPIMRMLQKAEHSKDDVVKAKRARRSTIALILGRNTLGTTQNSEQ